MLATLQQSLTSNKRQTARVHKTQASNKTQKNTNNTQTHSSPSEGHLNLVEILHWTPTLAYETFLSDVNVEKVQGMVDSFDFTNFCEPILAVGGVWW